MHPNVRFRLHIPEVFKPGRPVEAWVHEENKEEGYTALLELFGLDLIVSRPEEVDGGYKWLIFTDAETMHMARQWANSKRHTEIIASVQHEYYEGLSYSN